MRFAFAALIFIAWFCHGGEADPQKPVLTILYTAEAHAALLPCDCPLQPLGGVARRATLIKQYRERGPVLLVDGGGWAAGGIYDEESDGDPKRDELRTELMAKAMRLMQYDITAAGPLEAPVVANEALAPGKVAWNRATQVFAKGFNVPINVTAWNEPGTHVLGNIAPEAPAGAWHKLPH
jgi:hypothetical protein